MPITTCPTDWLRHDLDGTLRFGPMLNGVLRREAPPADRTEIARAYLAFAERQLAGLGCRQSKQPCADTETRRLAIEFYEAIEQCAREVTEK